MAGTTEETNERSREASSAIAAVRSWYHSIEVAPGVVTPGMFDLRPITEQLPWPNVRGKRCLDVGSADGFLAFELERRGAAEVVAADLGGHEDWDFEPHRREIGPTFLNYVYGPTKGLGFRVAAELLGSSVSAVECSVYDLRPDSVGEFDVVVCGSLLLHLSDPLRALAAIRSVCRDRFMSTNQVELGLSLLHPRLPLFRLDGTSGITQWWLANVEGHRQMIRAAGFELERESGLYSIPYGPAHPARGRRPRAVLASLARRAISGNDGVLHHALLAQASDHLDV
ncbi:MAG TPA: class I SAM-dependent methyltransferase [Solirubrobacteraceae bacterium]|nr:class I SAM-dependent methyltransferase [Solirubrobacteraceae bacterium]